MKARHSPSPWAIKRPDLKGSCDIEDVNGNLLAAVFVQHSRNSMDGFTPEIPVTKANARLIASAPDLLAALDKIAFAASNPSRVATDKESASGYIARIAMEAIARAKEGKE